MMIFDAFVILTCLASLILCTRSVIKGIRLQRVSLSLSVFPHRCHFNLTADSFFFSSPTQLLQEFVSFFQHHYKKDVSFTDQMEFVNGWYIMIIVSDVLTIIGSTLKMEIQAKVRCWYTGQKIKTHIEIQFLPLLQILSEMSSVLHS